MTLLSEVHSLYRFGIFELDTQSGELRRNGVKLRLPDQPYQVLLKLLQHAGQTVTRDELRNTLWTADTFVDFETGLNTTIKRLRETLGDSADNPAFIETVPKRGYRFIAPVTLPETVAAGLFPETAIPNKSIRPVKLVWLIAIVLVALLSIGFNLPHWREVGSSSLRVLDFDQLTSDSQAKQGRLVSDGSRIYFSEVLPVGRILVQVSARGGETTTIPTSVLNPSPVDISPDGTELLILSGYASKTEGQHSGTLWILPVAGGSAQPVGDIAATDALWGKSAETIVYCEGHDLYVVNRDGSKPRKLRTIPGNIESLRWSPKKDMLRFTVRTRDMGGKSSIWEISADGQDIREVVSGLSGATVSGGAWMLGSSEFLFEWTRAGRTDLWELPGPKSGARSIPVRLTAGPMSYSQLIASREPNQAFVVGSIPRAELVKYDESSAELVPYLSGISAEGVEVSRDGKSVAYTLFPEGTLWRSKLDGSERVQLTFPPMRAFLPRWSPDGKQIAFTGTATGDRWTTFVVAARGGEARPLITGSEDVADATWMPDNNSVIFGPWNGGGSRGIKLLNLNTKEVTPIAGAMEMWSPRVSPDGRYIAGLSQQESQLMLFDVKTQKWEKLSDEYSGYPSWSRDGAFLYFQDWNRGTAYPSRVLRIRLRDRKVEIVVDLKTLDRLSIGTFMSWSGLTADDSVLLSRNNSTQEIYAVKW